MYLNDLDDQEEEESQFFYILLGIGCGLQLFFFLTKTPIAFVLKSSALIADGVNSLAACVLAVMGIVASVPRNSYERLDIIDDVVRVVVSFFIAGYGTYVGGPLCCRSLSHPPSALYEANDTNGRCDCMTARY